MQQNNAATARRIKVPGPEHPIAIERNPKRVVITAGRLVVADGYHRVCAVYHLDEDAEVACKLVGSS